MLNLSTTFELVGVTPDQVYNWFLDLDTDGYNKMHPRHRKWEYTRRTPDVIGTVVYMVDELDESFPITLRISAEVLESMPNRLLFLKIKSLSKIRLPFPVYLSLVFNPSEEGTDVVHELRVGYGGSLGKIIDRFLRKSVITQPVEEVFNRHAEEEFKSLEELLQPTN